VQNPEVSSRCSKAPYHSFILPPSPPSWTEWFEIPDGCAVHVESSRNPFGQTVRVQCRSKDGATNGDCQLYSAVRFQAWDRDQSYAGLFGFTMVPRLASERDSWSEDPTDLTRGVKEEPASTESSPPPKAASEPDAAVPADGGTRSEVPSAGSDEIQPRATVPELPESNDAIESG
jgi:hypothetical protein